MIEALRELEAGLNVVRPPLYAAYPHPINLTSGSSAAATGPPPSPASASHFRLALSRGELVADLRERVESTVAGVAESRPTLSRYRIEVLYDGFQCEGYELEPDAPLITDLLDAAGRVMGHRPAIVASTATTDARSFHLYGGPPARLLRPARRERARGRRARPPALHHADRADDRAVHRGLVRPGAGAVRLTKTAAGGGVTAAGCARRGDPV